MTPREQWFWMGVGFASALFVLLALTVILVGMFFSYFVPPGGSPGRSAARPAEPPERGWEAPRVIGPMSPRVPSRPAETGAAARSAAGAQIRGPAAPQPSARERVATAPVRVAERPRRRVKPRPPRAPEAAARVARRDRGSGRAAAAPKGRAPERARPRVPMRVATVRQEWGERPRLRDGELPARLPGRPAVKQPRAARQPEPFDHVRRGTAPAALVAGREARYPTSAMIEGVTGRVQLRLSIDRGGGVRRAMVASSSGDKRLDAAALQAVKKWRYRPARRAGRPVAGTDHVDFDFFRDRNR